VEISGKIFKKKFRKNSFALPKYYLLLHLGLPTFLIAIKDRKNQSAPVDEKNE